MAYALFKCIAVYMTNAAGLQTPSSLQRDLAITHNARMCEESDAMYNLCIKIFVIQETFRTSQSLSSERDLPH